MTGFTSIAHYAPSLVLLAGAFTIAGVLGVGNEIGRMLRLPQPWLTTVGSIAALELLTLGVQTVAMAQIATRAVLITVWAVFSAVGSLLLLTRTSIPKKPSVSLTIAGTGAILLVNLAIALCPSTKADEVYYHMIVPSRIVQDGGLLFYREPMRSAIYPQMGFQIGFAPFHALGLPDGGNVVSWFFGALLVWFVYRIVFRYAESARWASIFAAATVAGLYTSVWHVTSGAHAIGDLAVTVAVVALYLMDDLVAAAGRRRTAATIGILAAAAASSKLLLLPFAAAILLIGAIRIGPRYLPNVILPPLIFMGPLMIWTAVNAGSPLGPLLEGFTGRSPYLPNEVRSFLDEYVAGLRGPILQKLRNEAMNYSPVLWVAIAGFVFARRHIRVGPAIGVALLVIQIVVILGWNTYDARYLGGVHYALMILFAIFLTVEVRDRALSSRAIAIVASLLIVPWMLLQIAYAGQFLKFIAHLESRQEFYWRYVPFFGDFVALDHVLPRNAVLLALPFALDSIYAPRPIYYHPLDVPSGRPTYLLTYHPSGEADPPLALPADIALAEQVYENDDAVIATYRIPGKKSLHGSVRVWRIRSGISH
jgi:hypothetical protein